MAALTGVKAGELICYLDDYGYHVRRNALELAEEVSQRELLLESLRAGKPGANDEERFPQRVARWKELAMGLLPVIYTLHRAIDSINQRYFDCQKALFPEVTEKFDQLLALTEKTADIYNGSLAGDIERLERLLMRRGMGNVNHN